MSTDRPRSLLGSALEAARYDARFFRTHPRFTLAIVVFLFIPALYAGIYLSSVWDAASRTRNLTVVLVNQDAGATLEGAAVEVGRTLVESLTGDPRFTYKAMDDPDAARRLVNEGGAAFAVLIPREFSARVAGADRLGAARFTVHVSEGNNYSGAGFARRFAPELEARLNQRLNEQRFDRVLKLVSGSEGGLAELRQAVAQLVDASTQVAAGSHRAKQAGTVLVDGTGRVATASAQLEQGLKSLDSGSRRLTDGLRQTAEAIHTASARLPPDADLARLRQAAAELAQGERELAAALVRLEQGAGLLRDGTAALGEEAASVPFGGRALADGAVQLRDGSEQLRSGLAQAAAAGQRLEQGASALADNVAALTLGTTALGTGLSRLDAGLPARATLDAYVSGSAAAAQAAVSLAGGTAKLNAGGLELQAGLEQLDSGATRVRDGLNRLRQSLPPPSVTPSGTPAGLSATVRAQLEYGSRVQNQATAMAPSFVTLALWVGVTLCAVLFAYQQLPSPLVGRSTVGIVIGKLALPSMVVIGQALLLAVLLEVVMNIQVESPTRFVLTLVLTSLTFLAMLFMLVRVFGSAGKLLAVILLVTQLGASGATLPIELASPFFQALHPWLPLSWSVRSMRVAMFGAYGGAWLQSIATMGAMCVTALAVATVAGRWQVVEPERYQPMVD